eukprot:scaffold3434_cov70-Cylindrotheca_fusiformis.AAC.3
MFCWAEAFDYPIGNWDVSNVNNTNRMFDGAKALNQYLLGSWKVGKVDDMTAMIRSAQNFDQPVNDWDVSSVKSMEMMFYGASVFNQSLCGWHDKSSIPNFHIIGIGHLIRLVGPGRHDPLEHIQETDKDNPHSSQPRLAFGGNQKGLVSGGECILPGSSSGQRTTQKESFHLTKGVDSSWPA